MTVPDQLRQEANDLRKQADMKDQEAKRVEAEIKDAERRAEESHLRRDGGLPR